MIERQDPLCEDCDLNDSDRGYCEEHEQYECTSCHLKLLGEDVY